MKPTRLVVPRLFRCLKIVLPTLCTCFFVGNPAVGWTDSDGRVKVSLQLYFVQAYDEERNPIEGSLVQIPMDNVLVSIREAKTNRLLSRGRTKSDGTFKARVRPGKHTIGIARTYFADQFCQVPAPACLGYQVELPSRSTRMKVKISEKRHSFTLEYQEEFGV